MEKTEEENGQETIEKEVRQKRGLQAKEEQ